MAVRITEPAEVNPGTQDWQDSLHKLTKTTGGLLLLGLTNMDNGLKPAVAAGSRFEINGNFFEIPSDEEITGALPANGVYYIYAKTNYANPDAATDASFFF